MSKLIHSNIQSCFIRYSFWPIILCSWTILVFGLCTYAIIQSKSGIYENAKIEAKTSIFKDIAYRKWASSQGGVYVVPTEKTPPNPYLQVSNRDVITTDGMKLTLINPAYMTRQVYESTEQVYGIKGHLTSLNCIRYENKPDQWEESCLKEFEKGIKEVTLPVVEIDGKLYLRHMMAFVTEKSCLKCHGFQGYSEGDVRGGISVSVPMEDYYAIYNADRNGTLLRYSIIWIIGFCGILVLRNNLNKSSAALQASEKRFRMLIEKSPDGNLIIDPKTGRILDFNTAAHQQLGYTREEFEKLSVNDIDVIESREDTGNHFAEVLNDGYADFETIHHTKQGEMRNVHVTAQEIDIQGETIYHCVWRDITEYQRAKADLIESEERFKALHNASFGGIAIHDKGVILECNQGLAEMTGYSEDELIGMDGLLLIAPSARDFVMGNILNGFEKPYEAIGIRKNGEEYPLRLEARNIPYKGKQVRSVEFRDFTDAKRIEAERQHLQDKLLHAQKMEAIGTLAGGIAHDFNNILGAILGYAEMAKEDSESGSRVSNELDKVIEAGNRAAGLVRQILAFSRQTVTEPVPLNPEHIVLEAIKLLRPSLPSTIAITQQFASRIHTITADPTQIHQIVMNLCTNAFQAMENTGGTLNINLENRELSIRDIQQYPNVNPGKYVVLSVSDTGPGIPSEIRDRIFDPYFTTKEIGKGTGMGLAIIHGIATSMGGFVTCESTLGLGSVFRAFLPATLSSVVTPAAVSTDALPEGNEHVLVVDDEEALAEMEKMMLERLGYRVTLCTDSTLALTLVRNDPGEFDLLVTDQTMPGMTGLELARNILQIRPDFPIILCTGYSNLVDEETAKKAGVRGFIMKPLSKKGLAELLDRVKNESGLQKQVTQIE